MPRRSGILLHPTSLPGPYGIGDLGSRAVELLDLLAESEQSVWQILPLAPPGQGGSPYDSTSAFAGSPLLISPRRLHEEGLLSRGELDSLELPGGPVDFDAVGEAKDRLLRQSLARRAGRPGERDRMAAFEEDRAQRGWLGDWCLFHALRRHHRGAAWYRWPADCRDRQPDVLEAARRDLASEVEIAAWAQYLFDRQWTDLRRQAERRGIEIYGDLPLYVAADSADVWSRRELFRVGDGGELEAVAGVPPDAFTATGQRWGNPLYAWRRHEEEGFAWWIERLRNTLRRMDLVRLDHFRGLQAFWEIPADAPTAIEGRWVEAPGEGLLRTLRDALGSLPLVAEDLGVITPEVDALRDAFGLPGMKVLQFAFTEVDSTHLPHHHVRRSVVYTGTHDNDTTVGWVESLSAEALARACEYLGTSRAELPWQMVRAASASVADLAILPLQDVLGLDGTARMNRPGSASGNWRFRLLQGGGEATCWERLASLTRLTGRAARRKRGQKRPESGAAEEVGPLPHPC